MGVNEFDVLNFTDIDRKLDSDEIREKARYYNRKGMEVRSTYHDYNAAVSYFSEGLCIAPYFDALYRNRSLSLLAAGRFEYALNDFLNYFVLSSEEFMEAYDYFLQQGKEAEYELNVRKQSTLIDLCMIGELVSLCLKSINSESTNDWHVFVASRNYGEFLDRRELIPDNILKELESKEHFYSMVNLGVDYLSQDERIKYLPIIQKRIGIFS